jgi:hypothetical protein
MYTGILEVGPNAVGVELAPRASRRRDYRELMRRRGISFACSRQSFFGEVGNYGRGQPDW